MPTDRVFRVTVELDVIAPTTGRARLLIGAYTDGQPHLDRVCIRDIQDAGAAREDPGWGWDPPEGAPS